MHASHSQFALHSTSALQTIATRKMGSAIVLPLSARTLVRLVTVFNPIEKPAGHRTSVLGSSQHKVTALKLSV